jgi:hypothetical protein
LKFEANKDNFHDNIWYFTYNPLDGVDKAKIDFGDGDVVPVWPPRGQVTHQYDRPGRYTVKITDGKRTLGTVAVDAR